MSNVCEACNATDLGPPFGTVFYACLSELLNGIGLEVIPTDSPIVGPSGTTSYSKFSVVVPYSGTGDVNLLTFDSARIANAAQYAGYKLPTGSIQGFLNKTISEVSNTVATNAGDALVTTLAVIMLIIFILFTIVFIVMMCYSVVSPGMGIAIILIGLMIIVIGFVIIAHEIYKSVINAGNDLESQGSSFIESIKCALSGGVCCYSNIDPTGCCCSDQGSNGICNNPSCQGSPCNP
jgi:hypothetical protein